MSIYVPLVGQYDNIGDIVLRRELFQWTLLSAEDPVRIYMGESPKEYDTAIVDSSSPDKFEMYRKYSAFYKHLLADKDANYIFKPGEIQLSLLGLKEHVSVLPALLKIKSQGNEVVRVGSGVRRANHIYPWFVKPSVALSGQIAWREPLAGQIFGGSVAPDLAFAQGSPSKGLVASVGERQLFTVSLRFDRCYPSPEVLASIASISHGGLEPVIVSQVRRDDEITARLAGELDCRAALWGDKSALDQERTVRQLYSESLFSLSDRLHVLIIALTEGSIPLCSSADANDKIRRHMDAAGISEWKLASRFTLKDIEQKISGYADRIHELERARSALADLREEFRGRLACSSPVQN